MWGGDEQIKERMRNDDDAFQDAFAQVAGAVMGQRVSASLRDGGQVAKDAIHEILRYYGVKPQELPGNLRDLNEQLEYLMRPSGIMRRTVNLKTGWYRDAVGAMLGTRIDDGSVVALIPAGLTGYCFTDAATDRRVRLNRKNQGLIAEEAVCFYKPLPLKAPGLADLMRYTVETLSAADFALIGLATLAVTLVGMLGLKLNNLLFSTVIESGSARLFWGIAVFFLSVAVASMLLGAVKNLLMARIDTKLSLSV